MENCCIVLSDMKINKRLDCKPRIRRLSFSSLYRFVCCHIQRYLAFLCTHLIKNITTLDTSLLDHAITKVNGGIATAAFCRFSQWLTSIRPSTIALFSSFASSISTLTCIHTHTHPFLSCTYTQITHLPEPRIRTDKKKKKS